MNITLRFVGAGFLDLMTEHRRIFQGRPALVTCRDFGAGDGELAQVR